MKSVQVSVRRCLSRDFSCGFWGGLIAASTNRPRLPPSSRPIIIEFFLAGERPLSLRALRHQTLRRNKTKNRAI